MSSGTEIVWQRNTDEIWHVLAGQLRDFADQQPAHIAPISLKVQADGAVETSVPEHAGDWAEKVKKWSLSAQGPGQLIAKDAQDGSSVRLEIARYRVNVVMQAPVALVQIDQSFYNPYGTQQEGTFVFNLPAGASVSRFAMFVTPHELIEGELIDRRVADRIYTSIVRRRRDPAILEQIGDNLFRMRVFPIFARDTKRILLDYTADNAQAAQIAWDLYRQRELPDNRLMWMLGRLIAAGRGEEVIPILEQRLKRNEPFDDRALDLLAAAYRQANRNVDARRAKTQRLERHQRSGSR